MQVTKTRKGVLPFASAHNEFDNAFDLTRYQGQIALGRNHQLAPFLLFYHLFWDAIENPSQRQSEFFEENGYEYETYAEYDPDTCIMHTNYPACPHRDYHHIHQTCPVCGSN
jgi:hypothetical protein